MLPAALLPALAAAAVSISSPRRLAALLAAALVPSVASGRECSTPASPAETVPGHNISRSGVAVQTMQECVQLCSADCSCVTGMLLPRRSSGGPPRRPTDPGSARAARQQRVPTGVGKRGFICSLSRAPARVVRLPPSRGLDAKGPQAGPWAFSCSPCTRFPGMPGKSDADKRWADGCQHVYLDVGSNSGVQIRKLYEPELYNLSNMLPVFASYFGNDRRAWRDVCTFAFEPNIAHAARLRRIEALYRSRGIRVKIFTHAAVGVKDGSAVYYQNSDRGPQLGGALFRRRPLSPGGRSHAVRTIDLSRWLQQHVAARRLPERASKEHSRPHVVAKIDTEGYEWLLIPEMLRTRAICSVHALFVEFHRFGKHKRDRLVEADPGLAQLAERATVLSREDLLRAVAAARKRAGCNVTLNETDDESYHFEGFGKMDWMHQVGGSPAAERQLPPVHVELPPADLQAEAQTKVSAVVADTEVVDGGPTPVVADTEVVDGAADEKA
eukprot:TRINITY_DN882_c0_g1_i1.p1 TRINITY_DN882_c0_g1~~TRINITY_DN882_c0_g1_i1.p1  ORF type:complete len:498 (+),score=91.05 TRINITY_DN882_c0_g1_i1:103-1596(+)